MSMQGAENKRYYLRGLFKGEKHSAYLPQFLFLFIGFLFTLAAFFTLGGFVDGLIEDERARVSQSFVEDVVEDFYALTEPLDVLSALITLSEDADPSLIQKSFAQNGASYEHFAQITWFYKDDDKGWRYTNIMNKGHGSGVQSGMLQPDAALLQMLIAQNVMRKNDVNIVDNVKDFHPREYRQLPKVLSTPFVVSRVVEAGNERTGFLLAVIDVEGLFDEGWIAAHKDISNMMIKGIDLNMPIFEFDRDPQQIRKLATQREVYEFPFAGQNFEVVGMFVEDPRAHFLKVFPYVVCVFGACLLVAGAFHMRNSRRQANILADMNEALEQKNFELKAEAEERDRLNQAIRASELNNRAVIDSLGDVIFETDDTGRITFLNKSWNEMTGFDVAQSTGQSLKQVLHPQDQDHIYQDFKNLVAGQKKELRHFTQLRMVDGTFKAVELVVNVIHGSHDARKRIVGVFTDIEERRRAERALSDAEKKYRSIVENAAGGIFQLTAEGLYLSANPAFARILGYDSPEQLLREVKDANEQLYVDPVQRQAFYKKLMVTPDTVSHDLQIRKRDGDVIWVCESSRAVKDEAGQLLFIEGSVEDITQRRASEVAIREAQIHSDMANRAKSEFLSNMSHELRTPLNSIIGFSEMIKNEVYGKIEQRNYWEYARDIHASGEKLLRVINEILDISKIEAGERQLNEGVVDIAGLVDGALDLLDIKIENAKILVTKSMDQVPKIVAEELAIKQVILNLLSNAVKFTPDGGRVTISAHVHRDGRLHVSVTDTGIGLDDYEIEKALSPFGQVNSALSREGSGTGLGLTLVDALVKLHGGEFELFSQKGIGTTATVMLPAERIVQSQHNSQNSINNQVDKEKSE